jgi:hypothetical protein
MRDDTNIHCHALKGKGNNKTRSKRDGDDTKTMTDRSKNRKDVFQFNFFKIYRHIVTLGRKVNTTLIISRDDKRDDTRFIVAERTLSSRY